MQPNNQNPYYPPRNPTAPITPPVGGNVPNFSGLPKSGPAWGWIITTLLLVTALLGALAFGFWAFGQRQDYKDNVDKKVAAAVEIAKKQTTEEDNKKFAEELKNPLKTYTGPESYGSLSVQYPKTWSAYIPNGGAGSSGVAVDAYFNPDSVPAIGNANGGARIPIALHVQVLNQTYDQYIASRKQFVDTGTLTATGYTLPKMPDQIGVMFKGQLGEQLTGTEVVLPLRDKTIVISTDTDQFLPDFNNYILPNLSFVP